MRDSYSDQQLLAYLDEALASDLMSDIEHSLRSDATLRERLVTLAASREAGIHGLGEIWRRHKVSCPTREQLGSYLLGAMDPENLAYIQFHVGQVQCRFCLANLDDLKKQNLESQAAVQTRRRRYFQTSAGYLSKHK